MKGIVFDMDGVLIDSMHYHAEAFKLAFKNEIDYTIDKRDVFLLEGMPGSDLVKEILKASKNDKIYNDKIIDNICKRKKGFFKDIQKSKAFEGVHDLIESLNCKGCLKAVVSGSSKQEVEFLLDQCNVDNFDVIITGDDLKNGKPDPQPFLTAVERLKIRPSEALIVENAPLGVKSAIRAEIRYIITLNNTPLTLDDFEGLLRMGSETINEILFKNTRSALKYLTNWCCE